MRYAGIKKYVKERFLGKKPDIDPTNLRRAQADAGALQSTLSTTGWAKLSERLSESFVDGLHEIFNRMRDGSYDKDKLLVQTSIVLSRLELINVIDLMLEDGKIANEELKRQADPQSIEELAQN